ncbi:sesquipedalian-1-like [Dunckerocampus dactyliophorus]|uniref:sesquipedalian-1-like n=1 Tax=Dunckerocampus dactyliophorus TaxID=161453 RepID=UPI002405B9B6|nr:sesquipedalian-1-like [Dunckerocampus dactyliophorus]XP_054625226.1 sesquipedalian-1-like [Dunckerocampus dactyliophorus]XP_054625227.1 sesquipedalian-1-like [Dunckerocampus dactyliophorus]XP_054625228.1 sesquipedalian-1-like [Dunckerocampus dactyliophorus]XP_054625229.1 sesquipedalian-1-like [Dunckerocampus dactyliophorus]
MKIDEKVVSFFESSNSPVDKEGYLFKKGDIRPSYHKRWFILKGNLLFYKDHPDDRDLIGVIVLEGCTVQLCESEEQFAFSLVWSDPGLRPYKFAAEDQASQESWLKALLSANYGYLALLVMDLEKKYRETLDALFSDPANGVATPNLHTTKADRHLNQRSSTWHPAAAAVSSGPSLSSKLTLQSPSIPPKSARRRSPKLWPKRTANVTPIDGPAPPVGEWSVGCSGTKEDFSKLHEDFGKEIKDLIADWSKSVQIDRVALKENLIDL